MLFDNLSVPERPHPCEPSFNLDKLYSLAKVHCNVSKRDQSIASFNLHSELRSKQKGERIGKSSEPHHLLQLLKNFKSFHFGKMKVNMEKIKKEKIKYMA
jgi:hypothetical protein